MAKTPTSPSWLVPMPSDTSFLRWQAIKIAPSSPTLLSSKFKHNILTLKDVKSGKFKVIDRIVLAVILFQSKLF
jgi:hypothetical protein